jgi:signal transduction histidine kinase
MSGLLFALLVPGAPNVPGGSSVPSSSVPGSSLASSSLAGSNVGGSDATGDRESTRRDRLADGIAIGLALAYGGTMIKLGDATAPGATLPWPVDVAIGVLCAATLVVRRRWPLGLALALLPTGAISVMATGAILVALFTAAIRNRPAVVLALAGIHVVTGTIYYALQTEAAYPLWVDLLMRTVTGVAAVGWGLFVQSYRRLTFSLRQQARRLEAEQELRVDRARLTERTRIAREMHDVLAHRMSLVSLHAGALEVRTDARPEEVAMAAGAIRSSVHEALQELRTVIGVLRDGESGPPEPPQPGLADLPDLLESARGTGMTVGYTCSVPAEAPPVVLGRTAYRVVQEALTNARKHAPSATVEVLLDGAAGSDLRILITNKLITNKLITDPPVTNPPLLRSSIATELPGSGMGLIGVSERVALTGGQTWYGPEGDRFRLEAWLPWPT